MTMWHLIKRNCKIYFKDKSVFWPSLITPLILLLLYTTFLRNVYINSFGSAFPPEVQIDTQISNGFVGGWLISSLIAVCCVTVAFSANTVMVSDKSNGAYKDLSIAPVKKTTLTLSYYFATAIVTGIICSVALVGGLVYLAIVGWYLSFVDVLFIIFDTILLILFGTALSSIIYTFIGSVGAVSAICTIVSAAYGFLCGAYMPISQFGKTFQAILMFLPGTYGTGLVRYHTMRGVLNELEKINIPVTEIEKISQSFDIDLVFFGKTIKSPIMYLVLIISVIILIGALVLINYLNIKKIKNKNKK